MFCPWLATSIAGNKAFLSLSDREPPSICSHIIQQYWHPNKNTRNQWSKFNQIQCHFINVDLHILYTLCYWPLWCWKWPHNTWRFPKTRRSHCTGPPGSRLCVHNCQDWIWFPLESHSKAYLFTITSFPSLYDFFLKLHQHFPIISDKSFKTKLWVYSKHTYFYSVGAHLIKILFLTLFNNKTSFTCDPSSISHCESIRSDHGLGERFTVRDHGEVIGSCARGQTQVVERDSRVGTDLRVGHHIVAGLVESSVCP